MRLRDDAKFDSKDGSVTRVPDEGPFFHGTQADVAAGADAPRVYEVVPAGAFEEEPNVADRKFPGNPTRLYRSDAP